MTFPTPGDLPNPVMGSAVPYWEAAVQHRELSLVLCDDLEGCGRLWEGVSGGKGYACTYR